MIICLHSSAVTLIRDNMLYLLLLTRLGAFLAASICLSGPSVICSSWPDPEAELRSAAAICSHAKIIRACLECAVYF